HPEPLACARHRPSSLYVWRPAARRRARSVRPSSTACQPSRPTSERSASLTAFESRNLAATSGSSRTTLVPWRYRSTYLPRTPPERSYSGSMSSSSSSFILRSLMTSHKSSTDQSSCSGAVGVNHGQVSAALAHPEQDVTVLADRMARIRDRDRQGIAECGRGFGERDPMLFEIALGFLRVPFEVHARLARLTITRSAAARKRRPLQRAVSPSRATNVSL